MYFILRGGEFRQRLSAQLLETAFIGVLCSILEFNKIYEMRASCMRY